MNIADLDALVRMLQDPDLRQAMTHPDWTDGYDAVVGTQNDRDENFFDLSDDQQFLHIVNLVTFKVVGGKLWAEESGMEPYQFKDGKWDNEGEDEDEDEDSDDE